MFSSIRVKLTVLYIGVLALMMAVFAAFTYTLFVRSLEKESDRNLIEIAKTFSVAADSEITHDVSETDADSTVKSELTEFQFRDYQFAVYSRDHRLIQTTMEASLPQDIDTSINNENFGTITSDGKSFRVFRLPFLLGSYQYHLYAIHALEDQLNAKSNIRQTFYLAVPLLLLLAGISGYFLARRSLEPISSMGERAKFISAANLHERLPIANPNDELGNLAALFNELLDRLDVEFERQRRFMADASHELRTPLAIIQGESEVALLDETRDPAEYQESLRIVNDEGRRLTKIVEGLLILARADSGELRAELHGLYLEEVVAECVHSVRTLAERRNIVIEFQGGETQIDGDEPMLRRLFLNLIDNAVKYSPDGSRISVAIEGKTVSISNPGDEIPSDERDSIFDRFYRVEKSRTHKNDTLMTGAGLGLAIAKWIADIHGAELKYLRSTDNENIFTVTFPH